MQEELVSLDTPLSKMNQWISTSASEGAGGRLKTTADPQSQGLQGKVLFMGARKDSEGKAAFLPQESPAAEGGGSRMPCALQPGGARSEPGLLQLEGRGFWKRAAWMMSQQFRV